MKSSVVYGTLFWALTAHVAAQTFTSCSPLNSTCPPDPALGTSFNETYSAGSSVNTDYWDELAGSLSFTPQGAQFQIVQSGDAPTIQTKFYIFFGRVEVIMRAASGQGIVSSIVLLSDDLDEIDWEIIGSNTTSVETNYFGKGNQTEMNAIYYPCDNPQGKFHNYTTVWTSEAIEYHLDEKIVRTLPYASAVSNGKSSFPQTPSQLKLGNWPAGDPSSPIGTRQWAGGLVNYNDGPFNMYVKSVKIVDGTNHAKQYSYDGHSGSWQSIDVERGVSEAAALINAPPPETISQRWDGLSPTAKIAIIASVGGVSLLLFLLFVFYCVRQRRIGKRERLAQEESWEREQAEMLEYKRRMQRMEFGGAKNGFVGVVHNRR